jgi:hypothetical protein
MIPEARQTVSVYLWVILISFYLATHKLSNHSISNTHLLYIILYNEDKEKGTHVIQSLILLHNSCMKFNEMEFSFEVVQSEVFTAG